MPLATRRDALKGALVWAIAGLPSLVRAGEPYEISRRERDAMNKVGEAFREKYAVPGLSVAIAHHGRIVYDEALGLADRENDEKLTTGHRFRIASVSKPITSAAIFDLIENKRLTLDAKVFGRGGVLATTFGKTPAPARHTRIRTSATASSAGSLKRSAGVRTPITSSSASSIAAACAAC